MPEKPVRLLTLIRHAKSSWQHAGLGDFERPLNDRGRLEVQSMGRRLAAIDFRPALLVTSPAERALDTAQAIAWEIGCPRSAIDPVADLYGAGVRQLVDVVRGLDPQLEDVALVAHNPGITDFFAWLCDSPIQNVPPCGVARLELEIASWSEIAPGCALQLDFDYPKRDPA